MNKQKLISIAKTVLRKLSSRKFLVCLAAMAAGYAGWIDKEQAAYIVITWVGGESIVDAASIIQSKTKGKGKEDVT
jgi:hypothetical protein